MEQKKKHFSLSWFFKWFLDNKAITVFFSNLIIGTESFILSKISFLFSPVLDFFSSCDVASHFIWFVILFVESYC